MFRRLIFLGFVVLVPLAVMIAAALPVVLRGDWARRRLHQLLTIQLAQTLDSEVRVGAIDGDLFRGFRIDDLAISEGRRLADGAVVSVDELQVKCDVWAAIRGEAPAIETVEEVRISGLRASLSRDRQGDLNIQRFLDLRKPRKEPPSPARFKGIIIVEDAEVSLSNAAPEPHLARDLTLRLTDIDAAANFADPRFIAYEISLVGAAAPFDRLEVDGRYGLPTQAVSAHAMVTGVDMATLARRIDVPSVDVEAGVVSAEANLCAIPGELLDFSVLGRARGVALSLPALEGTAVRAEAEFQATPDGIRLTAVQATALGAVIEGRATIFDLSAPMVDAEATARHLDLDRIVALVPEIREALPAVQGADSAELSARITGPVADPDIRVAGTFSEPLHVEYALPGPNDAPPPGPDDEPTLVANVTGLAVRAAIADLVKKDVLLEVSSDEVSLSDLGLLIAGQEYVREVRPAPLRNVTGHVLYSMDSPATLGGLFIDRIDTEHGPVEGIDVRYGLVGRTARADVIVDSVLGATVEAEGIVDLAGDRAAVYAEFNAEDVDLARVVPIAQDEIGVTGTAGAAGVFTLTGDDYQLDARFLARDLAYEGIETDRAAGRVQVGPEVAHIPYVTAQGPLGTWWGRGEVPFDGPIEVEFSLSQVPVSRVQEVAGEFGAADGSAGEPPGDPEPAPLPKLAGTAFVRGSLEGELEDPHLCADLAVLEPGVDEWTAGA